MMNFDNAKIVWKALDTHGFESWLVGGCVRDFLMGIEPHDIDMSTDAVPEEMKNAFNDAGLHMFEVGEKFGTIGLLVNGEKIEITTFRSEHGFTDGRHPDSVTFEKSLLADLSRRDLTINAIAMHPITLVIIDPFHGKEDLEAGIIRFVGNAEERINEDKLRMFRPCRFAGKLGFSIEGESFKAIRNNASKIHEVSKERIKDEWIKLMECKSADIGVWALLTTKLLAEIEPELAILEKIPQPKEHHEFNVLEHNVRAMMEIPRSMPFLRLVALHHDIGKTHCADTAPHFANHAPNGAIIFAEIADRLKMSNEEKEKGVFLIAEHMRHLNHNLSDFDTVKAERKIRRWLLKIGNKIVWREDLFMLWRADLIATGKPNTEALNNIEVIRNTIMKILSENQPISLKDLKINGNDLIAIGIPTNEKMGSLLNDLLRMVVDNPELNEREKLLALAKPI